LKSKEPKFHTQKYAESDNPKKRKKSLYPSLELAMQVYKDNGLHKTSGILTPLEKRLIDCLDDCNIDLLDFQPSNAELLLKSLMT